MFLYQADPSFKRPNFLQHSILASIVSHGKSFWILILFSVLAKEYHVFPILFKHLLFTTHAYGHMNDVHLSFGSSRGEYLGLFDNMYYLFFQLMTQRGRGNKYQR